MRATRITGPETGRPYEAYDTGETWNGAPVLAFTWAEISALIEAGDGKDSNGYGLEARSGEVLDVFDAGDYEVVATILAEVGGDTLILHVPAGRIWNEV